MINRCPRFGNVRVRFFPIEKGFAPRRFVFATGKLNLLMGRAPLANAALNPGAFRPPLSQVTCGDLPF
jgi:hypothetical protein